MASEALEKLDAAGAETITWIQEYASRGIQFVEQQAPELCSEIVVRGVLGYAIAAVIFGVLFVAALVLFLPTLRALIKDAAIKDRYSQDKLSDDAGVLCAIGSILGFIGMTGFGIGVLYNTTYAIQVYVCPRLFILEYLQDMI